MQEIKLKQQLVISQPAILKVLCFFIMLLLTVGRNEIQVLGLFGIVRYQKKKDALKDTMKEGEKVA